MSKKNSSVVYQDASRLAVESLLMQLRRENLRAPLSSEQMAVYCALCEVSRRMM